MPRADDACASTVPYSDAMPWPHSCAVADADALSDALSDASAVPNADAHAGNADAGPVSAILHISTASVPYDARTVPHASGSRIP